VPGGEAGVCGGVDCVGEDQVDDDGLGLRGGERFQALGENGPQLRRAAPGAQRGLINAIDHRRRFAEFIVDVGAEDEIVDVVIQLFGERRKASQHGKGKCRRECSPIG